MARYPVVLLKFGSDGFCHASIKAYEACVYVVFKWQSHSSHLLCSKYFSRKPADLNFLT